MENPWKVHIKIGLITENGYLNNGGVLLSDENPIYDSRIFCTRWNGLNKGTASLDAIDDRELDHQSILEQLDNAIKFVESNSKKPRKKTADNRIEMPDYPQRVVEEGLVNAIIHRDYSMSGSQIDVFMFDDRLEINSPGGMYGGGFVQKLDLRKVPSRRRNPLIADVFARLHYMERKGSGFGKILDAYLNAPNNLDKRMPIFESDNNDFRLILPNLNYSVGEVNGEVNQLNERDKQIYMIIKHNAGLRAPAILILLSDEDPELNVNILRKRIAQMSDLIEFRGSPKTGGYFVK